jgi:hypothetical protein
MLSALDWEDVSLPVEHRMVSVPLTPPEEQITVLVLCQIPVPAGSDLIDVYQFSIFLTPSNDFDPDAPVQDSPLRRALARHPQKRPVDESLAFDSSYEDKGRAIE